MSSNAPSGGDGAPVTRGFEETIASGSSAGNEVTMAPAGAREKPSAAAGTKVRYFGDYELLEEIARGGMGVVYKALQVSLNRVVALKMILAGQLAGKDDVQRFHAEAEAAANLDHPGIVPIYEIGEHEGKHYFSMAYVDGGSLAGLLKDGPLPPKLAAEFTQKISAAIAYAHERGVIHRDLKPGNVLLDRNKEPKITDFGLAKQVKGESQLTTTGQILGTPSYMPPEQAAGKIDEIGPAADIYSLGAVLYALLTGRPPFQSDNPLDTLLQVREREPISPRQLNPKVPADLETVCLKCLEKAPNRRYGSAQALAEEIGRYLCGEPILARPIGHVERGWRWCKRKPVIASLVAAIAMLLVMGTTIATFAAIKFKTLAEQERQTAASEREAKQKADAASLAAEAAQKSAESERNAARAANDRALDALAASQYQQAIAVRNTSQVGRKWIALDLLKKAEELRSRKRDAEQDGAESLPPNATTTSGAPSRSALRTEAVAALLTPDTRLVWQREWETDTSRVSFSPQTHRAAVAWSKTTIDVRNSKSAGESAGVRLIDLADGHDVAGPQNVRMWGNTIGLSADGKILARGPSVLSKDFTLWDVSREEQIRTLELPPELTSDARSIRGLCSPALSPNGKFAVGFGSGYIVVWDIESGSSRTAAAPKGASLQVVAFSPNGKHMAYRLSEGQVVLWDLESSEQPVTVKWPLAQAHNLAFSPDGATLAVEGRTEGANGFLRVMLWSVGTNTERNRYLNMTLARALSAMAYSPTGKMLACGDASGSVFLLDISTGKETLRLQGVHQQAVTQIAWSSDEQRLWSVGNDNCLKCWELASDPASVRSRFSALHVAFDPQGKRVAVVRGALQLLNRASLQVERTLEIKGHTLNTLRVFFRSDGQQLAAFGERVVIVWDANTGAEVARWEGEQEPHNQLISAAFTADGQLVAARFIGQSRQTAAVWNVVTGEQIWQLTQPAAQTRRQIHLSPNGGLAAVTPWPIGRTISLWDVRTGQEIVPLLGTVEDEGSVGEFPLFSQNGSWLAAVGGLARTGMVVPDMTMLRGGASAHVDVWSIPSGEHRATIRGPSVPTSYGFSPDSRLLAIGYRDGSAQLWSTEASELLFSWKEDSTPISQLAFSSDGSEILSRSREQRLLDLKALHRQLAEGGLDW